MTGIGTVDGHMYYGSGAVAWYVLYSKPRHELVIAAGNGVGINNGCHTVSADLFDITDTASVQFKSVLSLEAFADRMRGCALGQSRILDYLLILHCIVMYAAYLENTLCESSGFIKNDGLCL